MDQQSNDSEGNHVSAGPIGWRSAVYSVPGLHPDAPKRNTLLILIYILVLLVAFGLVESVV